MESSRGMEWIMFHGLPNFASSLPLRGGSNIKLGDHDTLEVSQPLICYILLCRKADMNRMVMK